MNKISLSNSDDNIELILNYLSDFSKIPTLKSVEELQEYKLDVFSEKFYANLLHNFLYFYTINGAKKVNSAEHKYLIKESVIALNIIYEDFPDTFLDDDFLKSLLIYLVYSLKETPIISTETVLKIFFGIYEVFPFNPLDILSPNTDLSLEERNIGGEYIESVSVFDWGGDLGFYEKFRTDAERYRDVKGSPCPHVPFFSYVPQYSQMKQKLR